MHKENSSLRFENNLRSLKLRFFFKLFKTTDPIFQSTFISLVFQRLLSFVLFACYNSNQGNAGNICQTIGERGKYNEIVTINYVPFGERALVMVTSLYEDTASHESVVENSILKSIIQVILNSKLKDYRHCFFDF